MVNHEKSGVLNRGGAEFGAIELIGAMFPFDPVERSTDSPKTTENAGELFLGSRVCFDNPATKILL